MRLGRLEVCADHGRRRWVATYNRGHPARPGGWWFYRWWLGTPWFHVAWYTGAIERIPAPVRLRVLADEPAFCPWCGADLSKTELLTSSPLGCGACRERLYEYRWVQP